MGYNNQHCVITLISIKQTTISTETKKLLYRHYIETKQKTKRILKMSIEQ